MLLNRIEEYERLRREFRKLKVQCEEKEIPIEKADSFAKLEKAFQGKANKKQLKDELERVHYNKKFGKILRNTIYGFITVAAGAVLIATLFMPVLKIYGSSMTPSLTEEDIVLSVKSNDFERGDILSFYYNNRVLVKRVIAFPGEWVDIDEQGNIYIDNDLLEEPYVQDKALGDCNIELPYQVPDGKLFVCGDYRSVSLDSRNTAVGCVSEEQIVGKIVFCVWPFRHIGFVD